jgi:hypothetical protein
MYSTITPKIKTILSGISSVKSVYAYPLEGTPKKYPCVVFIPDSSDNVMATNKENEMTLRYKIWIEVDIAGTTLENVFENILPKVFDDVISEFNEKWSDTVGSHRGSIIIGSGRWGIVSNDTSGKRAFAELILTYNSLSDI